MQRHRLLIASALCLLLVSPAAAEEATGDPLDELLAREGLERADLGWRPPGWWSRYPADIPYRLRHFDDLLAEPLAVVTFTRTAGDAARRHLDPEALATPAEQADPALYKAVHALGIERRFGGFRSYSANLTAEETDLVDALLAAHRAGGRPVRFHTFGQESPYPDYRAELEEQAAPLPPEARPILGRLVLDLVDAHRWVELAFRRVSPEARLAVQRRWDLGAEVTDALDYFPSLDDVAADWDEASLWYGGLKAVAALERARHALMAALDPEQIPDVHLDWPLPQGWVRIRGGGSDDMERGDSFLVVDLGGDDRYEGAVAASGPGLPVSVLLDLQGDDVYEGLDGPTQGAGLAGVGVLVDASGDDRYRAEGCAQGFGQLGLGLLADLEGDDDYEAKIQAQAAAFLGVGLLLDAQGKDSYEIHADGQGFGAVGGVATLADGGGDDRYEAVADPEVTGRPSYHSEGKVSVSNAQGVGMGRRGDGADGHSWAGGLGQLLDVSGDDRYKAGNWAMGTGYWFGTGLLWDGEGDDRYEGHVWTQASGAHFCIGALVDEAGDDHHEVEDGGRSSLSFGHDFAVTLLLDAAGDDLYEREGDGLAFAINRSFSFLFDLGGDDRYRGEDAVPGTARYQERFERRDEGYTYFAEASSLALFLDVGGDDDYDELDLDDDEIRRDPPASPNRRVRNWSLAADVATGVVDLRPLPMRAPSARPVEKRSEGLWD